LSFMFARTSRPRSNLRKLFQRRQILQQVCCFLRGESLEQTFWHQRRFLLFEAAHVCHWKMLLGIGFSEHDLFFRLLHHKPGMHFAVSGFDRPARELWIDNLRWLNDLLEQLFAWVLFPDAIQIRPEFA